MEINIDFDKLLKVQWAHDELRRLLIEHDNRTLEEVSELLRVPDAEVLWCYLEAEMEEHFLIRWGNDYGCGEFRIYTWAGKYFVYIDPDIEGIEGPFDTAEEIIGAYDGCWDYIFTEEQATEETKGYGSEFSFNGKLFDTDAKLADEFYRKITHQAD